MRKLFGRTRTDHPDQTADEPAEQVADEPADKGADEPATQEADEPAAQEADEPAAQEADEPAAQKADEPAAQRADEPTGDGNGAVGARSAGIQVGAEGRSEHASGPAEPTAAEAPSAEVAKRAVRLRALDEEIKRRGGELRVTKQAGRGGADDAARGESDVRVPAAPVERSAGAEVELRDTQVELREELLKLAGRLQALETTLQDTQRQNWEALHSQQESVSDRLADLGPLSARVESLAADLEQARGEAKEELRAQRELLTSASDARTEASKGVETRLAGLEGAIAEGAKETAARASALEAAEMRRVEEIEKLSTWVQAFAEELREAQRRGVEELRATHKPIYKRLSALETAASHASEELGAQRELLTSANAVRAKASEETEARLAGLEGAIAEAAKETESRLSAFDAATAEWAERAEADAIGRAERIEELSGRIESFAEELREGQRRSIEELRSTRAPIEERLTALETAASKASEELGAQRELLTSANAVRAKASEETEARLAGLEGAIAEVAEEAERELEKLRAEQRRSNDQIRAAREPIEERLSALETAASESAQTTTQVQERLGEMLDRLSVRAELGEMVEEVSRRLEGAEARLANAEHAVAASDEILKAIAKPKRRSKAIFNSTNRHDRVDLNEVTFEQLRELGLSATQATRLICQREGRGRFMSVQELDELPGFPRKELRELKKRSYVAPVPTP